MEASLESTAKNGDKSSLPIPRICLHAPELRNLCISQKPEALWIRPSIQWSVWRRKIKHAHTGSWNPNGNHPTPTLDSFFFFPGFIFSAVKQHLPWSVVAPLSILSDGSSWIRLEPVWLSGRLPASTKLNLISWEQLAKMETSLPITYPDTSPSAGGALLQ